MDSAKEDKFLINKYKTELETISVEVTAYKARVDDLTVQNADLEIKFKQVEIQLNTAKTLREESESALKKKVLKVELEQAETKVASELRLNTMNMVREDLISRISDLENKFRREQTKLELNIWKQVELKSIIEDKDIII